jgi:hypothetical protein
MIDGVLIGVVTLLAIGLGMAIVAVRLIYQPKRNRWQIAWLLFSGVWTVYPGHLTLSALGSAGLAFTKAKEADPVVDEERTRASLRSRPIRCT